METRKTENILELILKNVPEINKDENESTWIICKDQNANLESEY